MAIKSIKTFALASTLLAAVSLAGCDDQQTAETIAQIQKTTELACSFVPTAASVAGILSALYPAAQAPVAAASQVAQQICGAVTAKGARRGAERVPTVAGVVVEGHFVQR